MIEIDIMKSPLMGTAPCGDDLTTEEGYTAIEESVRQTHPHYDRLDWSDVSEKCLTLLGRTRDLRLAMVWSLAELRSGGFSAWTDTLSVLTAWIQNDTIWNNLFPRKVGARVLLVSQFGAEYATLGEFVFVKTISQIPLADACDANARTLRAWEDGRRDQVVRAIHASSPGYVEDLAKQIRNSSDAFRNLCNVLLQRLPHDDATNRDRLHNMQKTMLHSEQGVLSRSVAILKRDLSPPPGTGGASQPDSNTASAPIAVPSASAGEWKIESAPDVVRTLDEIIAYYKCEPSSPVPMILRRARSLVGLGFAATVVDLFGKELLSQLGSLTSSEETALAGQTPVPESAVPTKADATDPAATSSVAAAKVVSSSDVTAAIDALGAYLERAEPSSPVLLLLKRARRLVASSFRSAIEDLFGAAVLPKVDALVGGNKPKGLN